jgi:hypothetical protein
MCLFIFVSSGLIFKKLDKRLERSMLHSYRKVCFFSLWTAQQGFVLKVKLLCVCVGGGGGGAGLKPGGYF